MQFCSIWTTHGRPVLLLLLEHWTSCIQLHLVTTKGLSRTDSQMDSTTSGLTRFSRSCSPGASVRTSEFQGARGLGRSQPSGHLYGRAILDCPHIDRLDLLCSSRKPCASSTGIFNRQAHLDLATMPNCHGTTGHCLFDNAADGFLLLSLDRDSSKPLQEQQNSSMTPHFPDALNSLR